jgi:hypothetical protein
VGIVTNKLGGITSKLGVIRDNLTAGQRQGRVLTLGVDVNEAMIELVNTLDAFLSAGAGWAVSIDYIKPLVASKAN